MQTATATAKKKKKPPPKKRRPNSKIVLDESEVEVSMAYLRRDAGLRYETSLHALTVRELSAIPPFDQVSLHTITSWSKDDHWGERRKAFHARLEEVARERLLGEIVQQESDQLRSVQEKSDNMAVLLGTADPKSYEGMASAWIKMQEFIVNLRSKIVSTVSVDPVRFVAGSAHHIDPLLTPEEDRIAAEAIVRARKDRIEAEIKAALEVQDGEQKQPPSLRVVKGE